MMEKVQEGGAPAKHAEHWKAPEIVEFTLKYTALTFRKTFNSNNQRDILQQLKYVIHSMRPIIEGQSQANAEPVKWYLSLNMNTSHKPWHQDRSGCYVPLRGVQVHRHSRARLPISRSI